MALSVVDDSRVRQAVRNYLEAMAAAASNPAASPAEGVRRSELIRTVFPIAGIQDRSACMIEEFALCWGYSVAQIIQIGQANGVHLEASGVAQALMVGRGQIGR